DVVRGDCGHADPRVVPGDGLARRGDAPRVAVALRVADPRLDLAQHRVRRHHPERRGVPQVELQDPVPLGLELASSPQHRSPYVVPDVGQPARLIHHRAPPDPWGYEVLPEWYRLIAGDFECFAAGAGLLMMSRGARDGRRMSR